jgi:hypothetical protein
MERCSRKLRIQLSLMLANASLYGRLKLPVYKLLIHFLEVYHPVEKQSEGFDQSTGAFEV